MVDIKYIVFDKCYKIRVDGYLIVINSTIHNSFVLVNIWVDKNGV